jgi:predicted permease
MNRDPMPGPSRALQITAMTHLRVAIRSLSRSPLFASVAIVSLALGIGANTAIFTLMDQVLLRLLPIREPESIVQLHETGPRRGMSVGDKMSSFPMYRDIRDGNAVFDGVVARYGTSAAFGYRGQTERVNTEIVSGNYFNVLGIQSRLGRLLTPEDDLKPGAHPVVVLTHGFWQRKFAGDENIADTVVQINGHPMTVIGVTQPAYRSLEVGSATDILLPVMMKAQATPTWNELENRRTLWLSLFARLKPGMEPQRAAAGLEALYKQILNAEIETLPADDPRLRERFLTEKKLIVEPAARGLSHLRESAGAPLYVLMGMVGLVLLIACANVANLLTARAASRQKEIAIRVSLGASRWQVARQLLVESSILAFLGGCFGLLVSVWAGDLLLSFLPLQDAPRAFSTTPDARVLIFNFVISGIAALVFGLIPAIQAANHAIAATLKAEAGSLSAGSGQVRLRKTLVVAQISLSLLLLIGAGLFARSLYNLRSLHPGFAADNLLTFSVEPSLSGYHRERAVDFIGRTMEQLELIPGISLASATDVAMMTGDRNMYTVVVEGYTPKEGEDMNPDVNHIGPEFLSTTGIPLLAGREFTARDRLGAPLVCMINETMAKTYFPGENPIGRRIGFGVEKKMREIVGIVKDQKSHGLRAKPRRFVYAPLLQDENPSGVTFYARTALEPNSVAQSIRSQMQQIDSNVPVNNLKSMEVQVSESLFAERLIATLSAGFGLLATLLAAIGLYGVMAYSVARRTREIGIRVALGAERSGVIGLVMREVALLAAIGIAVGLPLALALSRYIRSQLFGLDATDPITLAVATFIMTAVALIAGYIPAERAARVDPIVALRYE